MCLPWVPSAGHAGVVEEVSTDRSRESLVKVIFELPSDGEGWPPAASESLWAVPVDPGIVRLANTPFFVRGVASGDVLRVRRDADGQLRAGERLEWSGHCTIRVIPFRNGPLAGSLQRVLDAFAPLGVTGEGIRQFGIVALNVPPGADIAAVKRVLRDGEDDGAWEYEEGCIGDEWFVTEPD